MEKIPVRAMYFDYAKSGFERAFSSPYESFRNCENTLDTKRFRQHVIIGKRYGAGSDHRPPSAVFFTDRPPLLIPWPIDRCFPSGMRKLDAGHSALGFNKFNNPLQVRDMLIFPNTQVLRSDPASCFYCGRLNHNYACSAHCTASHVN